MCSVSHAQMQNSWIFDLCGFYTTASLTYAHSSVTPMRLTLLLRCCLRLLVSYSASAPQLSLFLLTRDMDPAATLDDLCEAVTTLEETERTARRVLGGGHPFMTGIEKSLQNARAALHVGKGASQVIPK